MSQVMCFVAFMAILIVTASRPLDAQEHLLIGAAEVQTVLGLSDEVRAQASELYTKYYQLESMTTLEVTDGRPFISLSTKAQNEFRPKIMEEVAKLDTRALEELQIILTPEQLERLRQLRIQALGVAAILKGTVTSQLKIDEAQLAQLQNTAVEFAKTFADDRKEDLAELNREQRVRLFRQALVEHLVSKLTEEQQKSWRELVGEPVELPEFRHLR